MNSYLINYGQNQLRSSSSLQKLNHIACFPRLQYLMDSFIIKASDIWYQKWQFNEQTTRLSFSHFFSSIETCRKNLLSHGGRYLWTFVPLSSFAVLLSSESESKKFISIMDHILSFRVESRIRTLRLYFSTVKADSFSCINSSWMIIMVYKIIICRCCWEYYGLVVLPPFSFTCKTLVSLPLQTGYFFEVLSSVCFPSLDSPKLEIVCLNK